MLYLTDETEIKEIILELSEVDILWLDTEVADYQTKNPRLSLIQMLANPDNLDGSRTYLLDVLNKPELRDFFITNIMENSDITKVFHNAQYDLRFLGETQAKQVVCTLELAKKIPYYLLPVSSRSLKSLTEYLTNFKQLNKEEQKSDWGRRPLTPKQLAYAQMDCIYLREIYYKLRDLVANLEPDPLNDNLELLAQRYQEIEEQWQLLDSEINHLKERLKKAMVIQNKDQVQCLKLSSYERKVVKANLQELVKLVNNKGLELDLMITLTKAMQTQLGQNLAEINVEIETTKVLALRTRNRE
ncbi:MAG: 3'-5' exonuclease [Gloeocapsa sp. DLM2.Bin57]|nr:MAG: 3'-5' exonuclease [Gloeocapsa sp. DLM2.Bin57]